MRSQSIFPGEIPYHRYSALTPTTPAFTLHFTPTSTLTSTLISTQPSTQAFTQSFTQTLPQRYTQQIPQSKPLHKPKVQFSYPISSLLPLFSSLTLSLLSYPLLYLHSFSSLTLFSLTLSSLTRVLTGDIHKGSFNDVKVPSYPILPLLSLLSRLAYLLFSLFSLTSRCRTIDLHSRQGR